MMAKRYCKDGHKDQQWQIDSDLDHQYGKLINLSLSLATNPDQTIILWHFPHPNGMEQTLLTLIKPLPCDIFPIQME